MNRRHFIAAALASAALPMPAFAQDKYPSRPVKILVPYAPGGATDYAARWVAEKAKVGLAQNITIENKPGANGIIAIEELARSPRDGYTLMIGNVTTNCITPVTSRSKMSIDYDKEVVGVARLLSTPNVFLAAADFPARTFKEFVDYAKKNPGKVRYGSSGIGSFPHYDSELLARRAGLDLVHIPYKGGAGEMVKGILNGETHVTLLSTPITVAQAKAGRVHVLAAASPQRLSAFPDTPTLGELGYPDVGTLNWSALFAPAGTSPEILKTLHKAFTDAVKDPWVVEAAGKTGTDTFPAESIEETQKWLTAEMQKWRGITQEIKIEMN